MTIFIATFAMTYQPLPHAEAIGILVRQVLHIDKTQGKDNRSKRTGTMDRDTTTHSRRRQLTTLLALGLLMATATWSSAKAQPALVMPPFLSPGDTIAVVSPSSTPDTATVERGCQTLRLWGYHTVVGSHALSQCHGFAGTADERTADLLWALSNPTVKAIVCTRGGDGAIQLLQRLKTQQLRSHPKWLVGFSDITTLHSAMVQAGVMSIHGSMCHAIGRQQGEDTVSVSLRRMLSGQLPHYTVAHHQLDQQGKATGTLVGGNLSVISSLAGSDYDFLNRADEGLILFIEDKGESMTKVDRMIHQMELRGVLGKLKGIIVGRFSDYKHPENGFDDMYHMLSFYLRNYDIPVCYNFPVGHATLNNFPLIEGCRVSLSVGKEGTELEFIEQVEQRH